MMVVPSSQRDHYPAGRIGRGWKLVVCVASFAIYRMLEWDIIAADQFHDFVSFCRHYFQTLIWHLTGGFEGGGWVPSFLCYSIRGTVVWK